MTPPPRTTAQMRTAKLAGPCALVMSIPQSPRLRSPQPPLASEAPAIGPKTGPQAPLLGEHPAAAFGAAAASARAPGASIVPQGTFAWPCCALAGALIKTQ